MEVGEDLRKGQVFIDNCGGIGLQEMQVRGKRLFGRSQYNALRTVSVPVAHSECRIVPQRGVRAHHDGLMASSELVDEHLREGSGKTHATTIGTRNEAIGRLRPFERNPRTAQRVKRDEPFIELPALTLQYAHRHLRTGIAELLYAQAVYLGKRVLMAYHYTRDVMRDNKVGTRRSLSVVRTGFQAYIERALRQQPLVRHRGNSVHLCMRPSTLAMVAFADDLSVIHYHCAHHGIGGRALQSATCQLYATSHEICVLCRALLTFFYHHILFTFLFFLYLCSMNAIHRLREVYSPGEARAVYRLVMETRFHLSQTDILLGKDKNLSPHDLTELENILTRLLQGEPVQYVLGEAWFCGMRLHVEPGVLIPRPETEQLVEAILQETAAERSVLEVGTGSGCIAISLAKAGRTVTATDISATALRVASGNAAAQDVCVRFVQDDVLHTALPQQEQWDVVVSNPPYVCQSEAGQMEPLVLCHEPHEALFVPDDDPLRFYRAILGLATTRLRPTGRVYFEINRRYGSELCTLARDMGFANVRLWKDSFGNERFIACTR